MAAPATFDHDLSMYVEQPHAVDLHHVRFLRWLLERGRLEHQVAGPSSGALCDPPADRSTERSG